MPTSLRTVSDLRDRLSADGGRPAHVARILRAWLRGDPLRRPRSLDPFRPPLELEEALPRVEAELEDVLREVAHEVSADGGARRLMRLGSGRTIECVDLPRDGLCVSTQVGCAVGCRFCRTGEEGLLQQLTPLEVLAQVVHARRRRRVRRVVFMGMGEPAHNLDAVLESIRTLGVEGGIAHRNLVFSTVGSEDVFARLLGERVRPGLALSLHSLDPDRRADLLPRALESEPQRLLEAALDYCERTSYPLQLQWTLLAGINDSPAEAQRLARTIGRRRAIVNFIPFNPVDGNGYARPSIERCVELVRLVRREGVVATLRFSAAAEVEGGCGQLRARHGSSALPGAEPAC